MPEATAAAQRVLINQQLSEDLDWSTFELGPFGFGDFLVNVPPGQKFYQSRVESVEKVGVYVDVTAELNEATGEVIWEFISVDPLTFDFPMDALAGFLPPNVTPPEGQGFAYYNVEPKKGLPDGTRIHADALIYFDTNEAIATNVYVNAIDAASPTSGIDAMPNATSNIEFPVSWSGDDGNGSGIAAWNVYVSINESPFEMWLENRTEGSGNYIGEFGNSYGFYSIAIDNVGHREMKSAAAEATTSVVSPWQNPVNRYDVNNDNRVSTQDALIVINDIVRYGVRNLMDPDEPSSPPPFVDVNGNAIVSAIDALAVINEIGRQTSSAESEALVFIGPTIRSEPIESQAFLFSCYPETSVGNNGWDTKEMAWQATENSFIALSTASHQFAKDAHGTTQTSKSEDALETLSIESILEVIADDVRRATLGPNLP